jgi:hypothetical protein
MVLSLLVLRRLLLLFGYSLREIGLLLRALRLYLLLLLSLVKLGMGRWFVLFLGEALISVNL